MSNDKVIYQLERFCDSNPNLTGRILLTNGVDEVNATFSSGREMLEAIWEFSENQTVINGSESDLVVEPSPQNNMHVVWFNDTDIDNEVIAFFYPVNNVVYAESDITERMPELDEEE